MNEEQATKILKDEVEDVNNNNLYSLGWYLSWYVGDEEATLDGDFTADELEAIAWWMKNKKG